MSYSVLPPNPCLLAIVLIIKTRAGAVRLFHYPPDPGSDKPQAKFDYGNGSDEESSASSDDDDDDDDDNDDISQVSAEYDNGQSESIADSSIRTSAIPDLDLSGSVSLEKGSKDAFSKVYTGRPDFLGLPAGLEHMLSPPRVANKKRFEITIDGLAFLGRPTFSRIDGEWSGKKRTKIKPNREDVMSTSTVDEDLVQTSETDGAEEESEAVAMQLTESLRLDTLEDGVASTEAGLGALHMFHVVFVMSPPPLEYQTRVSDMYGHVVKKFSRALKIEQTRSNYVLKEAEKLRAAKAKHESIPQMIRRSSLAKAISVLYNSISTSRIAHVTLTPSFAFSLQIPLPPSISVLLPPTTPQLPGLWLTTATSIPTTDDPADLHHSRSKLAAHFALLLLADLPTILADVAAAPSPLSAPLMLYLRATSPTKSFYQISQASGIPLPLIQHLAAHLIYWRRARAVPPLHQRDVYTASPNADMQRLRVASAQYARRFPALPPLPKMLALLSSTPRPYAAYIPSKDHKAAYFDILAWLLRGGWVTQLRTFAWVRVPTRIRAQVAREVEVEAHREMEREGRRLKEREFKANEARNKSDSSSSDSSDDGNDDTDDKNNNPSDSSPTIHKNHNHNHNHSDSHMLDSLTSETSSISSARTVIPLSAAITSALPPILIERPTQATGLEARYLAALAREMQTLSVPLTTSKTSTNVTNSPLLLRKRHGFASERDKHGGNRDNYYSMNSNSNSKSENERQRQGQDQGRGRGQRQGERERESENEREKEKEKERETLAGSEVREAWERCLKYLNGEHALEKIAVREGWKRKRVEALRAAWSAAGVLLEVRHW